ncbi:winged helix-turn-helix domain-containing protein [Congregibacter sp.]|uniref:winged helix-turn-helix domain-containing protein n=1 Tax=Congregibacter sp. TaxID=2744308 RepID=UPI003F6A81F0
MTEASRPEPGRFVIGDFQVDPGANALHHVNGATRHIEPKAMLVLCALFERAGDTVSREELLATVWPGRVVVEETLTRAVSQLRQALGDVSKPPAYIQTVPKRGYRLIASVDGPMPSQQEAPATRRALPARRWLVIGGFTSLALLAALTLALLPTQAPVVDASVAVLPLRHLEGDDESAYLADGVTEELLNALASVPELRVPSRHSSFAYRDQSLPLADIAAALDVRHVLEGSVQRAGSNLRISARLVDVASDSTLWSQQYDGDLDNIFAFQKEIAAGVIAALEGTLLTRSKVQAALPRTDNIDAYSRYLQGNYYWMNGTTSNWFYQARDAFTDAIRLDPNFARAHASLAYIYARHDFHDQYMPADEARALALEASTKALALDSKAVDAYLARAILATSAGNFSEAATHLEQALEIRPRNAVAHNLYAELNLARNAPDAALASAARALEIDPLSPWVNVNNGIVHYYRGEHAAASAALAEAIRIAPDYTWAWVWQAAVFHAQGRLADAIISMEHCATLDPASETNAAYLGLLYLEIDDPEAAGRWFEQAATLQGDGDSARLWRRLVPLLYERTDDQLLVELSATASGLHNTRYSLLPAVGAAYANVGSTAAARDLLLDRAPALSASSPRVRPRNGQPALALLALQDSADGPMANAIAAGVSSYPAYFRTRGLEAWWYFLQGQDEQAVDSLTEALNIGWLPFWWMLPQLSGEAPQLAALRQRLRTHAAAEAARLQRLTAEAGHNSL